MMMVMMMMMMMMMMRRKRIPKAIFKRNPSKTLSGSMEELAASVFHRAAFEGSAEAQAFEWQTAMGDRWADKTLMDRELRDRGTGLPEKTMIEFTMKWTSHARFVQYVGRRSYEIGAASTPDSRRQTKPSG